MKVHKSCLLLVLLVGLVASVQAQVKTAGSNKASTRVAVSNSNIHSVNIVLRQQMRQIPKDLKAGKITKAQAQAAWENLKNVRRQELEFFKQNGQKEITPEQKTQLEQTLSQNTGSI